MSLPYVKINFANGAIGGFKAMDDGCTGLICTAEAIQNKFALNTNYLITSLNDLGRLGFRSNATGANGNVYKCVKEFYAEAPTGTKLYLRGVADSVTIDELVHHDGEDPENEHAWPLLEYARGEIRTLVVKVTDASGYEPDYDDGLDELMSEAMFNAQELAEAAANDMKAPIMVLLEGRHYSGTPGDLVDLNDCEYNRVVVVIGDTKKNSTGAAVGLVAGRIAAIPVQRSTARVKDGAIKSTEMYIGIEAAESGHPEVVSDKGFICPRTFVGKAGYYWSDDKLATSESDDYSLIPRRRTADKAARIAYATMLEQVSDEIALTAEGKIAAAVCKSIETNLESAIINQMTSEGNISTDPEDPNDTGVKAYVDPDQNIAASSHLDVQLRIRPYGYSKYIEVNLGFQTLNN